MTKQVDLLASYWTMASGAVPHTDWLQGRVALDEDGFVLTGAAASAAL